MQGKSHFEIYLTYLAKLKILISVLIKKIVNRNMKKFRETLKVVFTQMYLKYVKRTRIEEYLSFRQV